LLTKSKDVQCSYHQTSAKTLLISVFFIVSDHLWSDNSYIVTFDSHAFLRTIRTPSTFKTFDRPLLFIVVQSQVLVSHYFITSLRQKEYLFPFAFHYTCCNSRLLWTWWLKRTEQHWFCSKVYCSPTRHLKWTGDTFYWKLILLLLVFHICNDSVFAVGILTADTTKILLIVIESCMTKLQKPGAGNSKWHKKIVVSFQGSRFCCFLWILLERTLYFQKIVHIFV